MNEREARDCLGRSFKEGQPYQIEFCREIKRMNVRIDFGRHFTLVNHHHPILLNFFESKRSFDVNLLEGKNKIKKQTTTTAKLKTE